MLKRRCIASVMLLLLTVATAQAASSPVEMLRDLFRSPVTEWKQILNQSKALLNEQFFTNVEKRVRWGIENNHIDDAMRFAMVGDFASEVKNRPAPYRIDLAQLFFDAENFTMASQMVENILITSPDTPPAKRAKYLKAAMFELKQDFFSAHLLYVELAEEGYESGVMWYKAGQISMWLQQEDRGAEEWSRSLKAGHAPAGVALEKYKRSISGDWSEVFPAVENSAETEAAVGSNAVTTPKPDADKKLVDAAVAIDNGDLASAKSILQELNRENPQDSEVTRKLSALLYRMGELEEAKAFLDAALATSPQDVELLRFRANTTERMFDRSREIEHLQAALVDYTLAVKLAPNHAFLPLEYERAQKKKSLVSGR
jgi:tetratricopeptide (TPR) repeat protein